MTMTRATYRLDPETGKYENIEFLEKKYGTTRPHKKSAEIMRDIKPFISPVTGEEISSRPKLKAHNRKHGVTNMADYSEETMIKKTKERVARATGNTKEDRQDRIDRIKHQLDTQGRN